MRVATVEWMLVVASSVLLAVAAVLVLITVGVLSIDPPPLSCELDGVCAPAPVDVAGRITAYTLAGPTLFAGLIALVAAIALRARIR